MYLKTIETRGFGTNCYIIACEKTAEAGVIDPGGDGPKILNIIRERGLKVRYIINTHGHIDHIAANRSVREATGAEILIHEADASCLTDYKKSLGHYMPGARNSPPADRIVAEGDMITLGRTIRLIVVHTPGHTVGGISLVGDGFIFTGDTLFAGSIGRTDFPGGSLKQLMHSIREKLLTYPDDTIIYPGHGPSSTLGVERKTNPFLLTNWG